jgi:hypothetical protein
VIALKRVSGSATWTALLYIPGMACIVVLASGGMLCSLLFLYFLRIR